MERWPWFGQKPTKAIVDIDHIWPSHSSYWSNLTEEKVLVLVRSDQGIIDIGHICWSAKFTLVILDVATFFGHLMNGYLLHLHPLGHHEHKTLFVSIFSLGGHMKPSSGLSCMIWNYSHLLTLFINHSMIYRLVISTKSCHTLVAFFIEIRQKGFVLYIATTVRG